MFRYTTTYINIVAFILTLIIFNIFNCLEINMKVIVNEINNVSNVTNEIKETIDTNLILETNEIKEGKKQLKNEEKWEINIPKIKLKAPIAEGTTDEVMNKYVGHFEESSIFKGNICLAAHNRGYPVNYFKDLKLLEIGDVLIYILNDKKVEYKIIVSTVIKDTDWTYLQKTNDNRITLITCVENEPEYRRCIQAIQI